MTKVFINFEPLSGLNTQELAMVMAKHAYRPSEEETKNVLKMRGGQTSACPCRLHNICLISSTLLNH